MTTTNTEISNITAHDPHPRMTVALVHLKDGLSAETPVEGKSTLSGISDHITETTFGELNLSYTHSRGHLVVSLNVPEIVYRFLWASPDSFVNAVFPEEIKEKFGIDKAYIVADISGVSLIPA